MHLGHVASTYLPADILSKYLKQRKKKVVHVCASDDFGTPILIAAEKEGKSPKEYVKYWNTRFREDLASLGIEYSNFDMTSSEENVRFVQEFFMKLYKNGFIYKGVVSQFYCEYDKKFLPDRYVKGKCPFCGAEDQYSDGCEVCGRVIPAGQILNPRCTICNRIPVMRETEHYFFRLSAFSEKLSSWLKSTSTLQQDAVNYVLNWIRDGLQDWDITRDISWGVPIPLEEAKGKVLYGWFDNHLCYITATLKAIGKLNEQGVKFWNDSTIFHFIGKDIVYHHYLFLPAMRIGHGEFKLPDYIPVRGHLLLDGRKFSKSRNWMITVRDFVSRYPADYLRFYLARIVPNQQADSNFEWKDFEEKINNELVANIGNFIHRAMSFAYNKFEGKIPEQTKNGKEEDELEQKFSELLKEYEEEMNSLSFDRAIRRILEISSYCNQYFQKKEPWKDESDSATTVFVSLNFVARICYMLYPFMPFSSRKTWNELNIEEDIERGEVDLMGKIVKSGASINKPEPVFSKVSVFSQKNLASQAPR